MPFLQTLKQIFGSDWTVLWPRSPAQPWRRPPPWPWLRPVPRPRPRTLQPWLRAWPVARPWTASASALAQA
eukprot:12024877-Alexandrium_andersonii.AAC.1